MDDLTDAQLAELEQQLRDLIGELEGQMVTARDGSKPVDLDEPIGRLSRMDALQQQQMTKAHRRRLQTTLQQANAALGKFARDEYGECSLCGELIGYKRLSVRPESPMCLECQTARER